MTAYTGEIFTGSANVESAGGALLASAPTAPANSNSAAGALLGSSYSSVPATKTARGAWSVSADLKIQPSPFIVNHVFQR